MLNQKIRETIKNFRQALPSDLGALIEQGAGEISALDIIEQARKTGDPAPDFTLNNQIGESRSLSDYLSTGPLVVTFYRGAWCPYCNLQLKEYDDHLGVITATGANLVAITPEKPGALDILASTGAPKDVVDMAVKEVAFDVLHDSDNTVAKSWGVVFELPDSHQQLLKALNIDVESLNGDNSWAFPDPATYVIKPSGKIAWAFVPNNYRKRAEVDQILTALQGIRS